MANLMTPAEVISTAFDRSVESNKVPAQLISAVQQKIVLPILGEDFYDAVVADTASYSTLIGYIKPMLAFYVAYYALPQIFVEAGSVGIGIIQGQNRAAATNTDYEKLRQNKLEQARMNGDILRKYLEDNESSYSLYFRGSNPQERIKIAGGIIMRVNDPWFDDDEDDYTINLENY